MVGLAPAGRASAIGCSLSLVPRFLLRKPGSPPIAGSAIAVAGAVAVASALGAIGADSRWLAALGREILELGQVPDGVPFASAPSSDWPNVLVLAEVSFHG